MIEITDEYQEKLQKVSRLAEEEFPKDNFFVESVLWDDGTFEIAAKHHRSSGGECQWRCSIRVGSGESSTHSDIGRRVLFTEEAEKGWYYLIWRED